MADAAARFAIVVRRYQIARFTIRIAGIDLSARDVAMEVRFQADTPGAPLIQLDKVATVSAEGIKVEVATESGIPVTYLKGRLNKSTMSDAAKVPYVGEIGSASPLFYGIVIADGAGTIASGADATERFFGEFVVEGSAFGSNAAPMDRPQGFGYGAPRIGGGSAGSVTFGDTIVNVSISGVEQVTGLIGAAKAEADRSKGEADSAARSRSASEAFRDASKGWAEGPSPDGTPSARQHRIDAGVAAAYAGEMKVAIEALVGGGGLIVDPRMPIPALSIQDLVNAPSDTPIGRVATLLERGREGVWVLRAGDYRERVTSDPYKALYVRLVADADARTRAWVRVVSDSIHRFSWLGLNEDTPDALPLLQVGAALFPANAAWELPAHRLPMPTNDLPEVWIEKDNVRLYGAGRATHIDYTGAALNFKGIICCSASGLIIENLRASGIAVNTSAANPAIVAITARQHGSRQISGVTVRDVEFDRTSLGVVGFMYRGNADGSGPVMRPRDIRIERLACTTNGVAVSMFGVERFSARDFRLQYDPSLPSNAPAAKKMGFRVLGSQDGNIEPGEIRDFPTGILFDAAYVGPGARLVNRDMVVGAVNMRDVALPFFVVECTGRLSISAPVAHRDTNSTDTARLMEVQGGIPLSAVPANEDLVSHVGNITVKGVDVRGYASGIVTLGSSGDIEVVGNTIVGNKNTSDVDGQRGAVLALGVYGVPRSMKINGNDFAMTVATGQPSIIVRASTGRVEALDNLLPERDNPESSIFAALGVVFRSDGTEQRPFTGRVNLGTNRVHAKGTFANLVDGTPLPPPVLMPAPWTRAMVGVAEGAPNRFSKNVGAANAFDAAVYSEERLIGDFEFVYRLVQPVNSLLIGVMNTYRGPQPGTLEYGIAYDGGSSTPSSTYMRGGAYLLATGSYSPDTIERWRRQGTHMIFSRNGVDLVDVPVSTELALGLQASFARMGDAVEVLRFAAL